jgi:restriction system protein
MAVPGYQEFMLPLLRLAANGETWIRTAIQSLADEMNILPEDRALIVPSGQETVLSNRVHWAKTYLTKARLLEITRRGYFKITERGVMVLAQKPVRVDRKLLEQFEEYRQFRERSTEETSETPAPAPKRPATESRSNAGRDSPRRALGA